MSDEVKDLKQKIWVLEQKIALYEKDASYRGYFALNKIVNQQVDILNDLNLSTEIKANPKEDKVYDRVKALWSDLKTLIKDLDELKTVLKIRDIEEKEDKRVPFIELVATKRD
jgi:hypothetical protein